MPIALSVAQLRAQTAKQIAESAFSSVGVVADRMVNSLRLLVKRALLPATSWQDSDNVHE